MSDTVSGRVPSAPGSREPSPDGLGPSGFDPSRGVREQVFEAIQIRNGCVITDCGGCGSIVCASYLSDNCVCMDDYELVVGRQAVMQAERSIPE